MKMPFSDNTFDAIFAIEATCHAPDVVCHKRSLKRLMIFSISLFWSCPSSCSSIFFFLTFNFFCSLFCEWSRLIVTKRYTEC